MTDRLKKCKRRDALRFIVLRPCGTKHVGAGFKPALFFIGRPVAPPGVHGTPYNCAP
jgi:hypothetical protein